MMKKLFLLVVANFIYINSYSQCECTDCPLFVPSLTTQSSLINISGSTNPTLGVGGQSLCKVCVDMSTDAINEIDVILIAPNGSNINLVTQTGINTNDNLNYTICFLACSEIVTPDAGHADIFDSSETWGSDATYTGTYFPNLGCLEDLTGSVNGDWTLQVEDFVGWDDTTINDWYLVFGDDSGLGCANAFDCGIVCDADAGDLTILNSPTCPSDLISFSSSSYNSASSFDQYLLVADVNGDIVDFVQGDTYDYSYNYCGSFTIYSYNFEIGGGSTIPSIGSNITDYDCNVNCCDLVEEIISFEDNNPPFFTIVPEHPNFPGGGSFVSIFCIDDLNPILPASYNDNCIDPGSVMGEEINNSLPCDGGTIIRRWEVTDSCASVSTIEEQIITVEPVPIGVYIDPPVDLTVDCGDVPTTFIDLNYSNSLTNSCSSNGSASPILTENYDACGGTVSVTWSSIDECNRLVEYEQIITVIISAEPEFVNPPMDITVDCNSIPTTADAIEITNTLTGLCEITEMISPTITNNYNGCNGQVEITWEYTDDCNRDYSYTQIVTIEEAPIASFVNPPLVITIACTDFGSIPTALDYTNNSTGDCEISGNIEAVLQGTFNGCGGNVSYLWEYTDNCGRTINHTQGITITPAQDPSFVDVPVDITLDCGVTTYSPPPLMYTNDELGQCLIDGFVNATTVVSGNQIIVDWTLDLPCSSNFLTATQIVTILEEPDLFLLPQEIDICQGDVYDLQNINVIDLNNTGGVLSYHFDIPPDVSNELASSEVSPLTNTEYYIAMTTAEGCIDFAPFFVNVNFPDNLASDGFATICNDDAVYNLFDYLPIVNNVNGTWLDLDGTGIILSNPFAVSFYELSPGNYLLGYTLASSNTCDPDTAYLSVDIVESIELLIGSIICAPGLNTYSVSFSSNQPFSVNVDFGVVTDLGDNNYIVEIIPIEEAITIIGTDLFTNCADEISISPPDCSCPSIDPPISLGNEIVCVEALPITLNVSVGMDQSASWYTSAVGGTTLATETLSFMHTNSIPGTYTFYVETIDLINVGCVSTIRTAITLTILSPPMANDTIIVACQDHQNNTTAFLLSSANEFITNNVDHDILYFSSIENAMANFEPLDDILIVEGDLDSMVYARVTDVFGCTAIAELDLEVILPPQADLFVEDENCVGDSNGIINIVPVNDHIQFTSLDQGLLIESLIYENVSAGTHTITLQDSFTCINEIEVEIETGEELSFSEFYITCDDNETNMISEDDSTVVTLNIATTGEGASFEMYFDGIFIDNFSFDELEKLHFPSDSLRHTFTFIDVVSGCTLSIESGFFISCSPPCETLPNPPISLGDEMVCLESLPITLNVMIDADQSASWYSTAEGGTALAIETLSFMPNNSTSGTYIFYVETIDLINVDCVSTIRTAITLTILSPPMATDTIIVACQDHQNNTTTFLLSSANERITNSVDHDILYFSSIENAITNVEPLEDVLIVEGDLDSIVYARVADTFGCIAIAELDLEVLLPPHADLFVEDENCVGDSNGIINIVPINDHIQFTSLDQGLLIESLIYENVSAGTHTITLQDSFTCINEIEVEIETGEELSFSEFYITCDDNETNMISEDDSTVVTLNIATTGEGASFEMYFDDVFIDNFSFDELEKLHFPFDGLTHTFTFVDVVSGCTLSIESDIFPTCSPPCMTHPSSTILVDPSSILNCFVQSVEVNSMQEPDVNYEWYVQGQSVNAIDISIEEASEVILIAIDTITGCSSTDTINIIDLEAYPFVELQVEDTITCIDNEVLLDGSLSQSGPQIINVWTYNDEELPLLADQSVTTAVNGGWYYLEVIDTIIGCSNIDSVFVENIISYPQLDLEDSFTSLCGVDTVEVFADIIVPIEYNLLWSTSNGSIISEPTNDLITTVGSGNYLVSVTDPNNGCSIIDSINIIAYPSPVFTSLFVEDESCFGENDGSIFIDPLDLGNLPMAYVINGETYATNEIIDLTPGAYEIIGIDANGCELDTVINVIEAEDWSVMLPIEISFDSSIENWLLAQVNIDSSLIESISWDPSNNLSCMDCLTPVLMTKGEDTYTIEVVDINGCASTASISILYDINTDIIPPNIFSPNGDGINDYFKITIPQDLELDELTMHVFDRWGELIYANNQLLDAEESVFWDGTFNSEKVSPGVFVYIMQAVEKGNGKVTRFVGDITVVR